MIYWRSHNRSFAARQMGHIVWGIYNSLACEKVP